MNLCLKAVACCLFLPFGNALLASDVRVGVNAAVAISKEPQAADTAGKKEPGRPSQNKIDSQLLYLIKRNRVEGKSLPAMEVDVKVDGEGRVLIDISAVVTAKLISRIKKLGGEIVSSFPRSHTVRARFPLAKLEALAADKAVRFISPAAQATTDGAVTN